MSSTIAICYSRVNSGLLVPSSSSLLFNASVDSTSARHANLLTLIKQFGTIEKLAGKTLSAPAHLSQIRNRTRDMGRLVARRFEKQLELPTGWMDTIDHGPSQRPLDTAALVRDFEVLPAALQEHVSKIAHELRALIEGLTPEMRAVISAPPKDPARYAEWEANIRALIASEGR